MEKLNSEPYELLIVDLKIPGFTGSEWGGFELIDESMKLDPLRAVIVITGYGDVDSARKTLTRGVFDFIEKSSTAVEELIDSVQRVIEFMDEKIRRAGNPFKPRADLEPTIFGGRTEELEFFEDRLNRAIYSKFCEHFLVVGNWGIGKSTLLREYKKICQSRGHLASYVPLEPLGPDSNLLDAGRSIFKGILRGLRYPDERLSQVFEFLKSIEEFSILGNGIAVRRDGGVVDEVSTQSFLYDGLINLWKDIKDKTEVLVILFDDLENFSEMPEVFMTLKSVLSVDSVIKDRILIGLASTSKNWLSMTSVQKHHPLSRFFLSRIELDSLTKKELKDTIQSSLSGTGISFSPEIIQLVFDNTNGHPFEMQLLCYHLFGNYSSRYVDIDVWDMSLQLALKDIGNAIFEKRISESTVEEIKVLRILSESNNPLSLKDIQKVIVSREVQKDIMPVDSLLKSLVEREFVSRISYDFFSIEDRMFRAYLKAQLQQF